MFIVSAHPAALAVTAPDGRIARRGPTDDRLVTDEHGEAGT
jgi:hypothetical protein